MVNFHVGPTRSAPGLGAGVGAGVGLGVGFGVAGGAADPLALGLAVGVGDGLAVGVGEGVAVGAEVGVAVTTAAALDEGAAPEPCAKASVPPSVNVIVSSLSAMGGTPAARHGAPLDRPAPPTGTDQGPAAERISRVPATPRPPQHPPRDRPSDRAHAGRADPAGRAAGAMRLDETGQLQNDASAAGHQAQSVAQAESAALTLQQHQLLAAAKDRAAAEAKAAAARAAAVEREVSRRGAARTTTPVDFGPIPKSCQEFSGNRAIGCALVLAAGMDLTQMACLNKLVDPGVRLEPRSHSTALRCHGIPQALPGDKMANRRGRLADQPATQITWGLELHQGRYRTPCGAWDHSEDVGWY